MFFILTGGRVLLGFWIRKAVAAGTFGMRSVIVGADRQGQLLADYLANSSEQGTQLLGYIDDRGTRLALPEEGSAANRWHGESF